MTGNLLCVLLFATTQAAAQAPVHPPRFVSYEQMFRFIASQSDLEHVDRSSVFKLASESCVQYVRANPKEWYLVIRADYRHDHVSTIRGAQGNGPFYVFHEVGGAFIFLGVMFGNGYTQASVNGNIGFDVHAHAGGGKTTTAHYDVVGETLVQRNQRLEAAPLRK
jgi:hypothetical protein